MVVVGSDAIKKSELRRTLNSIKNVGGNVAGIVMNKMPNSSKKYDDYLYYSNDYENNTQEYNPEDSSAYTNHVDNLGYINDDEDSEPIEDTEEESTSFAQSYESDNSSSFTQTYESDSSNNNYESTDKTTDMLNQLNQYLKDEQSKLEQNNASKMGQ